MRELTDSERDFLLAYWFTEPLNNSIAIPERFKEGFIAGLDHSAAQIAALTAERDALQAKKELLQTEVVKLRARKDALEWVLGPFARVGRVLATFAPVLKPEAILWHQDNYDITVGDFLSARRVMDENEARRALDNPT